MADKISAIKHAITCLKILQNHVNIKRSGAEFYVCHCPFCQTKAKPKAKPKFWINARLDVCNCFSPKCASEKPMDVINLFGRLEGLSNPEAIRELHARVCTR